MRMSQEDFEKMISLDKKKGLWICSHCGYYVSNNALNEIKVYYESNGVKIPYCPICGREMGFYRRGD